jgi:Mce-associated membrane protein
VVAILMGTFAGVSAADDDEGPGNRAFVDTAATQDALASATQLSADLFTFDYTDLKAHEAKFVRLTTGEFTREYGKLFNDIVAQAKVRQMSMTSTVNAAAVRVLRDDRAEVLVFLDQRSTSAATNSHTAANAMFTATIQRVEGEWKFADIDLYEGS